MDFDLESCLIELARLDLITPDRYGELIQALDEQVQEDFGNLMFRLAEILCCDTKDSTKRKAAAMQIKHFLDDQSCFVREMQKERWLAVNGDVKSEIKSLLLELLSTLASDDLVDAVHASIISVVKIECGDWSGCVDDMVQKFALRPNKHIGTVILRIIDDMLNFTTVRLTTATFNELFLFEMVPIGPALLDPFERFNEIKLKCLTKMIKRGTDVPSDGFSEFLSNVCESEWFLWTSNEDFIVACIFFLTSILEKGPLDSETDFRTYWRHLLFGKNLHSYFKWISSRSENAKESVNTFFRSLDEMSRSQQVAQ